MSHAHPFRLAAAAVLTAVAFLPAAAMAESTQFPTHIDLPNGWLPEGIAAGEGTIMYSGSRGTGDVVAVDIRTGERTLVVDAPAGRAATGLELDDFGRLWVAGAATGQANVYDAATGDPIASFQLASAPTFINDVVITATAAWFTDSQDDELFRIPIAEDGTIGAPETVPLGGDYVHASGFNLNGIDATPGDRWLLAVQSNTGNLYRIDPATGAATLVDLGGEAMTTGDGILLMGRTLYVVRNTQNRIAVIRMSPTFLSGEVREYLTSPDFDIPTTVAPFGNTLYLVNARFTTAATPQTPYWMTAVRR